MRDVHIFKKSSCHHRIVGNRMLTWDIQDHGFTNMRHHHTKFSYHGDLVPIDSCTCVTNTCTNKLIGQRKFISRFVIREICCGDLQ